MKHLFRLACSFVLTFISLNVSYASGLIRDAEIENTLQGIMKPLTNVAPIASQTIDLYIISDPNLNAFVQGGQKIFVHTGLLQKTQNPDQLAGVLAHELGHITGGHLLRTRDAMSEALLKSLLTSAAIGAAAIASSGDGGSAIAGSIIAGNQAGLGSLTTFTRTQEAAADQAAITFLRKAGLSERGLVDVMVMLSKQELGANSYMRTHPLSRTRIDLLNNRYKNEDLSVASQDSANAPSPLPSQYHYDRMQAKLSGFLDTPQKTIKQYENHPHDIVRAIALSSAFHKEGKGKKAYSLLHKATQQHNDDAFLHDLAGQIALETGQLDKAIMHYKKAYATSQKLPLIGASYAQSLIASEKKDNIQTAIAVLKYALQQEKFYARGYRDLAIAYDRISKPFYAAAASAKYFHLIGDQFAAIKQARRALTGLPPTVPEYILVKDILYFSQQNQKKNT